MKPARHGVLLPPVRWTDNEQPGPHQVIRCDDDDGVWYVVAEAGEFDVAADIAAMLDDLARRRAEQ